jgi:hypothetical protein
MGCEVWKRKNSERTSVHYPHNLPYMCFPETLGYDWGSHGIRSCCVASSCIVVASVGFGDIAKASALVKDRVQLPLPQEREVTHPRLTEYYQAIAEELAGSVEGVIGPLDVPRTHFSVPDHRSSCDLCVSSVQSRSQPTGFEGQRPVSRYPLLNRYQATLSIGSDRTPRHSKIKRLSE